MDRVTRPLSLIHMLLLLLIIHGLYGKSNSADFTTVPKEKFPTIVYKDIGTLFHHVGTAITQSTNVLSSLFLKLDLPTLEHIKIDCGTCSIEDMATTSIAHSKCVHNDKSISNEIIDGPIKVPKISTCIKNCLTNPNCTYFTVKYMVFTQLQCTFRSGINLSNLKSHKDTNTVDINCLLKAPSYSCARTDNSLDQIFENAFTETSLHFWEQKLQHFKVILRTQNNTDNLSNGNKRSKRQLAAILPVATSFFSMGFTLFENYKLKKYVDAKIKTFDKFMTNTKEFVEKTIEFETEIVHQVKDLKTYFDFNYKNIICRENKLALQILQRQKLQSWKDTLDQVFQSLSRGDLTGAIPHGLIGLDAITNLIYKNKMLNSTIYKVYPELLTSLGTMTIAGAELSQGSAFIHVVFSIPTISKSNIYPLYTSEQVGITVNNICLNFDLPKHVIASNQLLYPIEADTCSRKNNLWICPFSINKDTNSSTTCLNGTQSCIPTIVKCTDRAAYSITGVLIHSAKLVYKISKQIGSDTLQRPKITSIDLGKHPLQTEFFSWSNYSEIQSAAGTFTALEETSEVIHISSNWGSNWSSYLEMNLRQELKRVNVHLDLGRLNDTINEQKKIFSKMNDIPVFSSPTSMIVIICVLSVVTIINTSLLFLIMCRSKCNHHSIRQDDIQDAGKFLKMSAVGKNVMSQNSNEEQQSFIC